MKHLRLFNTEAEFNTAKAEGLALPNVAYCKEEDKVIYTPLEGGSADAEVGDIVYVANGEKKWVSADEWNDSLGTPIGVVVVPKSHCENGENGIMMSLANMSLQTPESGSLAKAYIDGDNYMPWGDYGVDVPNLLTCDQLAVTDIDGVSNGSDSWGYFTSDQEDGEVEYFEDSDGNVCNESEAVCWYKKTFKNGRLWLNYSWWRDTPEDEWEVDCEDECDIFVQSPYNADGSKNNNFFMEGTSFEGGLSGKANTEAILAMCSEANKTATPISKVVGTNSKGTDAKQNYPSAIACSRFHTEGTEGGDWYLPSFAECMYLTARYNKINATLKALGANAIQMGELGLYDSSLGSWLWSSSEYSVGYAWPFSTVGSYVDGYNKYYCNYYYRVRAFCAF